MMVIKNWRSKCLLSLTPVLAITAVVIATPSARAIELEVNPVVILNAAAPSQVQNGTTYSWTGDLAVGYGLLTSFNLFESRIDLETGAIYLNQSSERGSGATAVVQNTHVLHIPLLFRYNFDERIGIGIGGYASFGEGSLPTGTHDHDYGLLVSARASIKILSQFYFIVDGRYQHGFTNLANTPPGIAGDFLNTRSMQAYLGLSYRFSVF